MRSEGGGSDEFIFMKCLLLLGGRTVAMVGFIRVGRGTGGTSMQKGSPIPLKGGGYVCSCEGGEGVQCGMWVCVACMQVYICEDARGSQQ